MEVSIEHRRESSRVPDSKEAHAAKESINPLLGPLTAMAFSAAVMAGACIVAANIAASGEAARRAGEREKNASDAVKEVRAQQSERASDPATADLLRAAQKRWSRPRTEMSRPTRCGSS
jgi:hypothetical protein